MHNHEWLEQQLHHVEHYIPDHGFTAHVLAKLPPSASTDPLARHELATAITATTVGSGVAALGWLLLAPLPY